MVATPREPGRSLYTRLFALLVVALVVDPLLVGLPVVHRSIQLALGATLVIAIWRLSEGRWWLATAVTVVLTNSVLGWLPGFATNRGLQVVITLTDTALLGTIACFIVKQVWTEPRVSADTIFGGLAGYLLLGATWARLYRVALLFEPEAISGLATADAASLEFSGRLLYFSFVTLTTLGYGDMAPLTRRAEMLAALEAVVGQLYIAVLVARIVGLSITARSSS